MSSENPEAWALAQGRNPLKTGLVTARNILRPQPREFDINGRNPLKTGLVTASPTMGRVVVHPRTLVSQSPENGSRHCKVLVAEPRRAAARSLSQSPENGSRHCKGMEVEIVFRARVRRRNPLKTGLVTASLQMIQNDRSLSESQSPENGSRHCKFMATLLFSC